MYNVLAFSIFTALMLAAFILMHRLGTEPFGFGTTGWVIAGAGAEIVSGVLTLLAVRGGSMYDDYQIVCMDRVSAITSTVATVLIPLIAVTGIVLDSVGFIVCAGMLTAWVLLLVNAAAAVVIGHWK